MGNVKMVGILEGYDIQIEFEAGTEEQAKGAVALITKIFKDLGVESTVEAEQ